MHYLTARCEVSNRRVSGHSDDAFIRVLHERKTPLTGLRQRMRELAQTRVRFGYRRLPVMVRREGWEVGKERTAVHREQRWPAMARNDIWSMDFVVDQMTDGRRFRALTVIDLFTHECLAIDACQGLSGQDVAATLERVRFDRRLPQQIYCDNGLSQKSMRHTFSTLVYHQYLKHRADVQAASAGDG